MQRCKGCGIGLKNDAKVLAVHLSVSARCLASYDDHTILYKGDEIVWGTLHLWEQSSDSKGGKWRIMGLRRNGTPIRVHAEPTKVKALAWIKLANRRAE